MLIWSDDEVARSVFLPSFPDPITKGTLSDNHRESSSRELFLDTDWKEMEPRQLKKQTKALF